MAFYRNKNPNAPKREDALDHPTLNISKATHQLLKDKSIELDLPVAKLIAIAIDNELDTTTPFQFDYTMPDEPYEEFKYITQAGKLLQYMKTWFRKGTGLDMLLLCRRDIGLEWRELQLAYRELLKKEMIEEFYPQRVEFKYAKTYRYARPNIETIIERKKPYTRITPTKGPLNDT